jgi:demethylspheroidene O-methyltransferase
MASVPPEVERAMPSAPAGLGFGVRWRQLRNRLLENPRFQAWAASFPFTRRIAGRHARALFDLCAGFVYSQVLYACVKLDAFELLAAGPRGAAELALRWQMPVDSAQRLLDAAASLQLLERRSDGRYELATLGAALRGNPGVAAMIEHHALLYADLADPVTLLREAAADTRLSRYWAYAGDRPGVALEPERVRDYTRLMARSQHLVAADILAAYPLTRHRRLLDVGGGDGSFALAAVGSSDSLSAIVADLPGVAAAARQHIAARGLADRIAVSECDALRQPLPTGADVASLVRVIHDHDDGPALTLLKRAYEALPPGGALLIAEPMAGTTGAEPMGDAYFGFYLLAMGSGRPRTADELSTLARSAGFAEARLLPTRRPLLVQVLLCRKAA